MLSPSGLHSICSATPHLDPRVVEIGDLKTLEYPIPLADEQGAGLDGACLRQ